MSVAVFPGWRSWREAQAALRGKLSEPVLARLGEGYGFAAGQISPRLEVVDLLVHHLHVTDPELLLAGVLYELVEADPGTLPEVRARFGDRAALLAAAARTPATVPSDVDASRLALARWYCTVQRLHTDPEVWRQRARFHQTCEYFSLATVAPGLAELFATWRVAYDYLARPAVDTLAGADRLAAVLHQDQTDRCGEPYIQHVRATARIVRDNGGTTAQQLAGLLHDTVEETSCTLEQLAGLGVPAPVVQLVDALTRRPDESQEVYLARLAATPAAIDVKRADIAHNSLPERLARLDQPTRDRLRQKYRSATRLLSTLERERR